MQFSSKYRKISQLCVCPSRAPEATVPTTPCCSLPPRPSVRLYHSTVCLWSRDILPCTCLYPSGNVGAAPDGCVLDTRRRSGCFLGWYLGARRSQGPEIHRRVRLSRVSPWLEVTFCILALGSPLECPRTPFPGPCVGSGGPALCGRSQHLLCLPVLRVGPCTSDLSSISSGTVFPLL